MRPKGGLLSLLATGPIPSGWVAFDPIGRLPFHVAMPPLPVGPFPPTDDNGTEPGRLGAVGWVMRRIALCVGGGLLSNGLVSKEWQRVLLFGYGCGKVGCGLSEVGRLQLRTDELAAF